MASATKVMKARINLKNRKAGLKRKNAINRKGSTPSKQAVFDAPPSKS